MTKEERIRRAQHFEHLKNDEYLTRAWKLVEDRLLAELIKSEFSERERRDYIYLSLKIMTELQEIILACVRDGVMAQKEIEFLKTEKRVA